RKMSKSYANAIGLTDAPREVFGKTMSLPDEAMATWFELLTRVPEAERAALLAGHPRAAKARLAGELVALLHGREAADAARAEFDRMFVEKEKPADIPVREWPSPNEVANLAAVLKTLGLVPSTSEARRRMAQGGVRVNDEVVPSPEVMLHRPPEAGVLVQYGKRQFVRIVPPRA
ncbi:MAG TPA: S4 domain-containing protein, partial [Planctomycetota bacterium]